MKKLIAVACLALPLWSGAVAAATLTDASLDAAMKKADPDNDGTLDPAEAAKFGISKAVFQKANPDKDGTLDKKELAAAVTMMFEAANPDKDGTLDWKEAQKAGIKSKAVFEAANPDKDGTLDLAEYLAALTAQLQPSATAKAQPAQADKSTIGTGRDWTKIDTNKDHSISPDEMESWLKANPATPAK